MHIYCFNQFRVSLLYFSLKVFFISEVACVLGYILDVFLDSFA